jgi:outer membrane protein assembly factor BamB
MANKPLLFALSLLLAGCGGGDGSAGITPPGDPGGGIPGSGVASVLTYHNDNDRSGLNDHETVLKLSNVDAAHFGKVGFFRTDGKVDAQPLFLTVQGIAGGNHNVLYVATEHGSAFAFDADSGRVLWHRSLLGAGEMPSDQHGCGQLEPEIGITATPVIDVDVGAHGALFVVAMSMDAGSNHFQRLHALDLATGAELEGGPVTIHASYPGTGAGSSGSGVTLFNPYQYKERAGLLLLDGKVYLSWASHCDDRPYGGWIMAYDEMTLHQTAVINIAHNGSGASVWASGAAPAADADGNIYFMAANGDFDTTLDAQGFPSQGDFGNAFMKLSTAGGTLKVADYFVMAGVVAENDGDVDLGSGGTLLLPDVRDAGGHIKHIAVGAGKDGYIYVPDRDDMGKFHPGGDQIWQELPGALPNGEFAMPAFFNGVIYFGGVNDVLRAFRVTGARLSTAPISQSAHSFQYPGATPSISSNGTRDAIVWVAENGSVAGLYAYDARDLGHELYDSNQSGARDQFGQGNKFIAPTVADGRVYVGTQDGVAVFGLLH